MPAPLKRHADLSGISVLFLLFTTLFTSHSKTAGSSRKKELPAVVFHSVRPRAANSLARPSSYMQDFSKFLHFFPAKAIDNARFLRIVFDKLDNIPVNISGLRTYLIIKVRTRILISLFNKFHKNCQSSLPVSTKNRLIWISANYFLFPSSFASIPKVA